MGIYTGKAKFSNGWIKFCATSFYIGVNIESTIDYQPHQYTMIVSATLNKHLSILPPYLPSTACKYIQSNETRDRESRALSAANWVTHSIMIVFSCFHVPERTNEAFKNTFNV